MTAVVELIEARLRAARTAVTRAAAVPLSVRCAIFLVALAAQAVAFPASVFLGGALPVLLVVAALPALAPARAGPTVSALFAVVGWLASTTMYGERVVLWRLLALAGALYLVHVLSGLASALPYDADVGLDVVAGPILRALGVLLASSVLSILLLGIGGGGVPLPSLAALLAGLAVAVGAVAVLGRLLRRG